MLIIQIFTNICIQILPGKDLEAKKAALGSLDIVAEASSSLPTPHFINSKKTEDFKDEEVAAAESHLAEIKRSNILSYLHTHKLIISTFETARINYF